MMSFLVDSLCNFLPTLLLFDFIQKDSLFRSNNLLSPHLLLVYHRDILIVDLVILTGVHQLAIYLLALLQEVGCLLEMVKLQLLLALFASPAWLLSLEGG